MATTILTDPTDLINGGDAGVLPLAPITVNETTKTITIAPGAGILPAASDGVTGQALYSALKILWKNSSTYIKYPFPMEAITPEQFEFINGWVLADDTTRKALRTCGWAERGADGGTIKREYMGVVSLGTIDSADASYYQWNSDIKQDFSFTGPLNEGIQVYGDATNGNFAYNDGGDSLTLFNRIQGKLYSSATNASIGANTLTYITYRFPLSNATDLKIAAESTDAHIAYSDTISTASWTTGTVTFTVADTTGLEVGGRVYVTGITPAAYNGTYAVTGVPNGTTFEVALESDPGAYTSGGTVTSIHGQISIDFTTGASVDVNEDTTNESYSTVVTDAAGTATTQEIYEKVQYLLRQASPTDIDTGAGNVIGDTQPSIMSFVGDTLVGEPGTYISGLNSGFFNSVTFYETTDTAKATPINYPFISSGTINFGGNAGSGDFKYWMFYTTLPLEPGGSENNDFGQANARIVEDKDGVPITGTYSGSPIDFSFNYDKEDADYGNGPERTPGGSNDAAVTVLGIGLDGGQYVSVNATITKSTGINILLAPAQERNFDNPA